MAYEPPELEELGSVAELTQATEGRGRQDGVLWQRYADGPGFS